MSFIYLFNGPKCKRSSYTILYQQVFTPDILIIETITTLLLPFCIWLMELLSIGCHEENWSFILVVVFYNLPFNVNFCYFPLFLVLLNDCSYSECRVPKDLNCLRIVDCISGVNNRCKHLRSAVAYQILVVLFSNKVAHFLSSLFLKYALKHQIKLNFPAKKNDDE